MLSVSERLRLCQRQCWGLETLLRQVCGLGLEASWRDGTLGKGSPGRAELGPASLFSTQDTRSPLQHPGIWVGGSPLIRIRKEGQSRASVVRQPAALTAHHQSEPSPGFSLEGTFPPQGPFSPQLQSPLLLLLNISLSPPSSLPLSPPST